MTSCVHSADDEHGGEDTAGHQWTATATPARWRAVVGVALVVAVAAVPALARVVVARVASVEVLQALAAARRVAALYTCTSDKQLKLPARNFN